MSSSYFVDGQKIVNAVLYERPLEGGPFYAIAFRGVDLLYVPVTGWMAHLDDDDNIFVTI